MICEAPRQSEETYLADVARRVRASWPAGLPNEIFYPIGQVSIIDHVRHWAQDRPTSPAIIFYGRELTFRELDTCSDSIAQWLIDHGVAVGDRVALFLPSCPQFTIAFLGILKAGAVAVPVSAMAKEMELAHVIADSGARLLVAQDLLVPIVVRSEIADQVAGMLSVRVADYLPRQPALSIPKGLDEPGPSMTEEADLDVTDFAEALASPPAHLPRPGWDDAAVINYTGGTTGLPKGCLHTHGDLTYTAASSVTFNVPSARPHVFCSFLPMFWIGGEVVSLLQPLVSGSTIVLLSRWDAETVMAAIDRYRVTTMALMVDGAIEIINHPRRGGYDLSSLENTLAVSFVTVLDRDIRARWKASVGTVLRESAWGMTETNTMDTFTTGFQEDDADLLGTPTFVGLPMPGTEFKIVDPETGVLMPLGAEGELHVRTPSLFKGYWNNPDATAAAMRDGWLCTSDTAIIDEHGLMTFRGRRREMLKVNGMSVFPSEVEALLMRHPAIAACGVTGRPDEAKGQIPVAFIQLNNSGTETAASLALWCRTNIAVYKIPEIRLVDTLPVTATGKVKRAELASLL